MSNTPNPQTSPLDETRDWFAKRDGWNYVPATIGGLGAEAHYWWKYTISPEHGGRTYSAVHPYPPTRDGAEAAMPEWWEWWRWHTPDGFEWVAVNCDNKMMTAQVKDTNDEIADRYALARLACEAMDKSKENK